MARAANRVGLEPPIAQGALLVGAPCLEHDEAIPDPGDDEREPFCRRLAQLAVGEIGGAEIDGSHLARHHASQRTWRCCGARNSQPLKTGGRSASDRRFGSRSKSLCTAIRIWTREKW